MPRIGTGEDLVSHITACRVRLDNQHQLICRAHLTDNMARGLRKVTRIP